MRFCYGVREKKTALVVWMCLKKTSIWLVWNENFMELGAFFLGWNVNHSYFRESTGFIEKSKGGTEELENVREINRVSIACPRVLLELFTPPKLN